MPQVAFLICVVIDWVGTLAGLFAFGHALFQRTDAFAAAERKTKPFWLAVTAGGTVVLALVGFYGRGTIFWLAAIVAVLVYLVDVRPKVVEVQRGGGRFS